MIFTSLLYEVDAFQHIRNIIDSTLLDRQLLNCLVEINCLIRCSLKQLNEAESQSYKSVFFASSLPQNEISILIAAVSVIIAGTTAI